MNIVMFRSYPSVEQAGEVKQALLEAGFSPKSISLISPGAPNEGSEKSPDSWPFVYDRNLDRQGSFADVEPATHDRNLERKGSFADVGPASHDRNLERQGSFADAGSTFYDRNLERKGSFADGEPLAVDEGLADALQRAGLSEADAAKESQAIREGATLLLVQVPVGSKLAAVRLLEKERRAAT